MQGLAAQSWQNRSLTTRQTPGSLRVHSAADQFRLELADARERFGSLLGALQGAEPQTQCH